MSTSDEMIEQFRKESDERFDKTRKDINRIFNRMIFVCLSVAAISGILLLLIHLTS